MNRKKNTNNESLPNLAASKILELIEEQGFGAGDQIPTENELVQILGVGRSTVREAIKILISKNVLEIRRGRGTFLLPNPSLSQDPLGLSYAPDKIKAYKDLLAVRMILEPWMAAEAAKHATDEDIKRISSLCREVENLIHKGEDHLLKDAEFHTAIAESTKNEVIPVLIPFIEKSISLFITMSHNSLKEETIQTHRAVTEAIALHDPAAAEEAMRLHIYYNERRING